MPAVAVRQPYVFVLREDEDAGSPRKDNDNFGKMVCFHSRYRLGDEHDYDIPDAFIQGLARDTVSAKNICEFAAAGKSESVRLSQKGEKWEVTALYFKDWEVVASFDNPLAGQEEAAADVILEYMDTESLYRLAKYENVILPLYLYDHSGLSMRTGSINDCWDSGQDGWIYVSKADAVAALGETDNGVFSIATEILESEVSEYDSYLRGECYGFQLYENGTEVDSCWGFIGSPNELKDAIESNLPDDCKGVMDSLEYLNNDREVEKYLLEQVRKLIFTKGVLQMSSSEITMEARAYPFAEPKNNQLGFASVTLNGGFALTGIKIMNGQKGPFVAMPSKKDAQGNYRDVFFPTTKELRAELDTVVMDAFNTAIEKAVADRAAEKPAEKAAEKPAEKAAQKPAQKKDKAQERPSAAEKLKDAKKEAAKAPKEKAAPAKDKEKSKSGGAR